MMRHAQRAYLIKSQSKEPTEGHVQRFDLLRLPAALRMHLRDSGIKGLQEHNHCNAVPATLKKSNFGVHVCVKCVFFSFWES